MALYRNTQWEVTDSGLKSIEPGAPYVYRIEASRLLETGALGDGELYEWPAQLGEKTWVDIEAFIEAYRQAINLHKGKYPGEAEPDVLEKSIEMGRRVARSQR